MSEVIDIALEKVHIQPGKLPDDYHCRCEYCQRFLGLLIRPDGTKYHRLNRRKYYAKSEVAHIAKTPLHVARWAVQTYSKPGQWVLDPTAGAGTTLVEALNHQRNTVGIELSPEHTAIIRTSVKMNNPFRKVAKVFTDDARNIGKIMAKLDAPKRFDLIINNPPYSGDEGQSGFASSPKTKDFRYNKKYKNNLAFLKEGNEYWDTFREIYGTAIKHLKKNGHFVVGVKDMMRRKEPFLLHSFYADMLSELGLNFVGTALLPHYPTTLFMNTYPKRMGIPCPVHQTIIVFKKVK